MRTILKKFSLPLHQAPRWRMIDTQPSPQQSALCTLCYLQNGKNWPWSPSILVDAGDADVIFESSDNVLFSIHRKNLEVATGAFPPSNFSTEGRNVALSESSSTLELMFQYVYPMPQPDVSSLPFESLALLAEAVEKYQVFPAILICKIHMGCVFYPFYTFNIVINNVYLPESSSTNTHMRSWYTQLNTGTMISRTKQRPFSSVFLSEKCLCNYQIDLLLLGYVVSSYIA